MYLRARLGAGCSVQSPSFAKKQTVEVVRTGQHVEPHGGVRWFIFGYPDWDSDVYRQSVCRVRGYEGCYEVEIGLVDEDDGGQNSSGG